MKKITIKLLLIALATLSLSSCLKDFEPTDVLSDKRKNEIAAADPDKVFSSSLAGMYSEVQSHYKTNLSHNYFGQKSFDYLTSLMGNDMIMTGRFGMSLYHYLLDYRGQEYAPTSNRWNEYYSQIASANDIIKSIDVTTATDSGKSYYAQALGFRAYAYLHLTYLYQRSYYVGADDTPWGKGAKYDWSNEPCVPLILEDTEGHQPRSTVKEIMDQIEKDLVAAYNIFAEIGAVKTADPSDFDGCVVANYLTRVYMIEHKWDEALKYADVVIGNYGYLTGNDIIQGFSDISLKDVLWGCDITSDNSTIYMSWFSQMDMFGDGYAGIGVWRAGFKPFVDQMADDDIRQNWFVTPKCKTFYEWAAVLYQSSKFIGAGRTSVLANDSGEGWELGDYIYLRSEEAYFNKAEILAHQNKLSEAASVLNDIMKSRSESYNFSATTKSDMIKEINYQKRVEFWGEGIEYLDNRRLNIPVDRTDETWGASNNHLAAGRFYFDQEDPTFLYQIPVKEIEANTALSEADQNE